MSCTVCNLQFPRPAGYKSSKCPRCISREGGDNPERLLISKDCSCNIIAPELRYADMCDACARLNNFDRSTAFDENKGLKKVIKDLKKVKRELDEEHRDSPRPHYLPTISTPDGGWTSCAYVCTDCGAAWMESHDKENSLRKAQQGDEVCPHTKLVLRPVKFVFSSGE